MTTGEIELLSYFPARHQPVHLADFTDHGRRKPCPVSSMATLIALIFFPSSPPEMIDVHAPSIPAGMCCLVFARRSLTESLLTEEPCDTMLNAVYLYPGIPSLVSIEWPPNALISFIIEERTSKETDGLLAISTPSQRIAMLAPPVIVRFAEATPIMLAVATIDRAFATSLAVTLQW